MSGPTACIFSEFGRAPFFALLDSFGHGFLSPYFSCGHLFVTGLKGTKLRLIFNASGIYASRGHLEEEGRAFGSVLDPIYIFPKGD